ncbi:periplasmic protein TonB [Pseudoalteromonas ulvae UL12]|uniref:energy transducer TonB n=1 Tax=Pseudoalteromonas ulvae TaxID=107327 RepID=UPI0019ED5931|nr:energy transducer TonB [Pseudoalteromonas ulvae]MBE0363821.1 periplasmic protein TonB [Pseudoalteromonas ulvae UL12]
MNNTLPAPHIQTISKVALFTAVGLVMTFCAFALMQYLIAPQGQYIPTSIPDFDIEIAEEKKITPPNIIKRLPPPPVINKIPPKPMIPSETSQTDIVPIPTVTLTAQQPSNSTLFAPILDNQASPVVRMAPKYPIQAAREGIEGWVKLSFSISKTGSVINASVLDAQPKRVFDAAAIKALKKWKYKTKVDNGQAIEQHGLTIQLDFKIDKSH